MANKRESYQHLLESNDAMFEEAQKELEFNMINAEVVSMKIPSLVQKYAQLMIMAKAQVKKADMELSAKYKERYDYYSMDHNHRIDRRDLEVYINGDAEYQGMQGKVEGWKLKVEYLDIILKALDRASFNINNAIKLHIFQGGG